MMTKISLNVAALYVAALVEDDDDDDDDEVVVHESSSSYSLLALVWGFTITVHSRLATTAPLPRPR